MQKLDGKKTIVKTVLFVLSGLCAGMVVFYLSSQGEFKSVQMNEEISFIVEKARWCNENFNKKHSFVFEDITNNWVSSFVTDSNGYVVGFHRPGNLQQNVFFGENIGPFIGNPADKEHLVYLGVKDGELICE
ncbi:MAG: hypothetical protein MJY93_10890 [Fibrobacter sp.]|nr:hypothetical protein [Fibrobacter sp.]